MAKKETKPPIEPNEFSQFVSKLSTNIGFSPLMEKEKKEKIYNPFAIKNSDQVLLMYCFLSQYKEKAKSDNILIPAEVKATATGKKVKFNFTKELKESIFEEIVEGKPEFDNLNIDNTLKTIEILNEKK